MLQSLLSEIVASARDSLVQQFGLTASVVGAGFLVILLYAMIPTGPVSRFRALTWIGFAGLVLLLWDRGFRDWRLSAALVALGLAVDVVTSIPRWRAGRRA